MVSVNVGRPRSVPYRGRTRSTSIWKAPVLGRVAAQGCNLEGDEQADRRVHGGADKAVYAYSCGDYAWWEAELGRHLDPGTFGENLTVDGIDLAAAVVGERWQVGSAELEVCQPRTPCWKLGVRMGDDTFPDRFEAAGRLGAYLRIAGEGDVGAGDEVVVVHRPAHGVTIDLVYRAFDDPSLFPAVLAAPELPRRLRARMAAHAS
ncbi:MAG: MOSC domain-containing protein [Actinobacteria bacterium]|nr:MOSC domain-containing protein [Actinomycetota bacterium]MBW3642974.1 MOSC domain-containing protein [Actinomycetota bacterium]